MGLQESPLSPFWMTSTPLQSDIQTPNHTVRTNVLQSVENGAPDIEKGVKMMDEDLQRAEQISKG